MTIPLTRVHQYPTLHCLVYYVFLQSIHLYMPLLRIHSDTNTHTNTIINILYFTGRIIMFKNKNIQRFKKKTRLSQRKVNKDMPWFSLFSAWSTDNHSFWVSPSISFRWKSRWSTIPRQHSIRESIEGKFSQVHGVKAGGSIAWQFSEW